MEASGGAHLIVLVYVVSMYYWNPLYSWDALPSCPTVRVV